MERNKRLQQNTKLLEKRNSELISEVSPVS
jgi:hypothetical protein